MMRLDLTSLILLTLLTVCSCSPLKNKYKAIASELHFNLTQVESNIEVSFPLSKTQAVLKISVEVENPTATTFAVREFNGELFLHVHEKRLRMGKVKLLQAARLPAKSKATLVVITSINYKDLAGNWTLVRKVIDKKTAGNWELSGTLLGNVHNIPVSLRVKSAQLF